MTAHDIIATRHSRHRLSVTEFLLLDREGAFDNCAKSELLEGEIFTMNAQHSRHSRMKTRLLLALIEALRPIQPDWEVLSEVTVSLGPQSAPEPDLVVTSYHGDDIVPVGTVKLVIEVADTTQRMDLGRKAALYAAAGIAEYWVVDVEAKCVHQLWSPDGAHYGEQRETALGDTIAAVTVDELLVFLD